MRSKLRNIVLSGLVLLLAGFAFNIASAQDTDAPPFLGITFAEHDSGVAVLRVVPGSPADDAGIEADDIITALAGDAVSADTFAEAFAEFAVGDSVTLDILRDGEAVSIEATLGERPAAPRVEIRPLGQRPFLGVSLSDTDEGVQITEVVADSAADEAGLQADDIITAINGETVADAEAAVRIVGDLEPGDTITLDITRDGEAMSIEATLGSGGTRALRGDFGNLLPDDFGARLRGGLTLSFDSDSGTLQIESLAEDSPLFEAGLREGDAITAINGNPLEVEGDGLRGLLEGLGEDGAITLTIERDGESLDIEVEAASLLLGFGRFGFNFGDIIPFEPGQRDFGFTPDGRGRDFDFNFGPVGGQIQLGVSFLTLDETEAEERGLEISEGALILDVIAESPADEAGLRANDIITAVDGDLVDHERTLRDRLAAYEADDTVTLSVIRAGETLELDATLRAGGLELGRFGKGNLPGILRFLAPGHGDNDARRGFFFGPDRFEFPEGRFGFRFFGPGQQSSAVRPNV